MRSSLFRSLYFQVVVALIAGIATGYFYPKIATDMKPLGDAFINGIKMVITPVVFCTIVSGIAGHYGPEEIKGRQVIVVANLAPRKMRGIDSNGMILMAEDNEGKLSFVSTADGLHNGSVIR